MVQLPRKQHDGSTLWAQFSPLQQASSSQPQSQSQVHPLTHPRRPRRSGTAPTRTRRPRPRRWCPPSQPGTGSRVGYFGNNSNRTLLPKVQFNSVRYSSAGPPVGSIFFCIIFFLEPSSPHHACSNCSSSSNQLTTKLQRDNDSYNIRTLIIHGYA